MEQLDQIDLAILRTLQEDGRITHADLAQQVGLTAPSVQRRVRLLEERGYIRGYSALLDPIALGMQVTAFILVESRSGCALPALEDYFAGVPSIQEVHRLVGEWCYMLKARCPSPQHLEQLLYRELRGHTDIRRTQTIIATSAPLETVRLDLPEPKQ